MKSKLLSSACLAGLIGLSACATHKESKLAAQARVSKADAQATALAKVPNGTIQEGELEKEDGKLIWSFDLSTPGTKDITEVAVDAITGTLLSVDHESAAAEAMEKQAEAKKKKGKHEEEDEKEEK